MDELKVKLDEVGKLVFVTCCIDSYNCPSSSSSCSPEHSLNNLATEVTGLIGETRCMSVCINNIGNGPACILWNYATTRLHMLQLTSNKNFKKKMFLMPLPKGACRVILVLLPIRSSHDRSVHIPSNAAG